MDFQVDSESISVGKAAIGNLLGGIGYFYGQSKIALSRILNVSYFNFLLVLNLSKCMPSLNSVKLTCDYHKCGSCVSYVLFFVG